MKKLLLLGVATLSLVACSGDKSDDLKDTDVKSENVTQTTELAYDCPAPKTVDTSVDQNDAIDEWFQARFMEAVQRSPLLLAQMGMKARNDEWDDPSRENALKELELSKQGLKELCETFDRSTLDESHQLSYDLMKQFLVQSIEDDKWHQYGYPFNQMFGAHSQIPVIMQNMHRVDNVDDAKAYIARLNGVDEFLGTVLKQAEESAELGILPPKFVYPYVIKDAENIMADNVFLSDFTTKVEALDLPEDETAALISEAEAAIENSVKPTYDKLISVMKAQEAIATTDDGAWKLPDGDAFYAHRLQRMTTTDMTADEIHELGLSEVARIHGEMRQIMADVGFEGDLQDFFTYLKTDPKFSYPNTDEGRAAYLAEATDMIEIMKGRLDEYFIVKPKADLEVRRVEAFREKSAGKAFYNRPAFDGSRPGIYYANLYDMADMPIYQMEALAYHEGIPGHHMHLALTQEMDIPLFQRFIGATAHTEGWGLYSEYLPKEMGFYEDPYSDFGRLAMELWRAARLVVDTGLHHKKWTREEAIDYLITNTPNPEGDCIKAIERYIVMPGQATAYKIGMIKILELREESKEKLGDKFDIREFHDAVLGAGAVPLDILEQRVDRWVASKI